MIRCTRFLQTLLKKSTLSKRVAPQIRMTRAELYEDVDVKMRTGHPHPVQSIIYNFRR
jgi:hypothetical protein